jgi:hypothetical protein
MSDWDDTVSLAGTLPIHWSVTLDEDGELTGYISPYTLMPTQDEDGDWYGTTLGLNQPLRSHPNQEMAAAAQTFVDIAYQQWIKPTLTSRLYKALVEQRDRQGGYQAGLKQLTDDQKDEGFEP